MEKFFYSRSNTCFDTSALTKRRKGRQQFNDGWINQGERKWEKWRKSQGLLLFLFLWKHFVLVIQLFPFFSSRPFFFISSLQNPFFPFALIVTSRPNLSSFLYFHCMAVECDSDKMRSRLKTHPRIPASSSISWSCFLQMADTTVTTVISWSTNWIRIWWSWSCCRFLFLHRSQTNK